MDEKYAKTAAKMGLNAETGAGSDSTVKADLNTSTSGNAGFDTNMSGNTGGNVRTSISGNTGATMGANTTISQKPDRTDKAISEAEAKLLLMEETRKTNKNLQAQEKKSKKTLTAVIVIAAILCVAGVIFAIMVGSKSDDKAANQGTNQPMQTTPSEDEEDDPEPEQTLEQLDVESEQIRQLYNYFGVVGTADLFGFYGDASKTGQPSNDYVIGVAMGNIDHGTCSMPLTDENIQARYVEQIDAGAVLADLSTISYNMGCYRGEDLRTKILEIFGKDASLQDGDKMIIPGWKYAADYDEIYSIPYVGGSDGFGPGRGFLRGIYEAWQNPETDKIYIYEVVAGISGPGFTCKDNNPCLDGVEPTIENAVIHKENFNNYRWIFTKTPAGNYVFSKIEKL